MNRLWLELGEKFYVLGTASDKINFNIFLPLTRRLKGNERIAQLFNDLSSFD